MAKKLILDLSKEVSKMGRESIKTFLEEELMYNVYVNLQGQLVHQSRFDREFEALGGDVDLLLDCCADNIYEQEIETDFDNDTEEIIDYSAVIKDYFESKEEER